MLKKTLIFHLFHLTEKIFPVLLRAFVSSRRCVSSRSNQKVPPFQHFSPSTLENPAPFHYFRIASQKPSAIFPIQIGIPLCSALFRQKIFFTAKPQIQLLHFGHFFHLKSSAKSLYSHLFQYDFFPTTLSTHFHSSACSAYSAVNPILGPHIHAPKPKPNFRIRVLRKQFDFHLLLTRRKTVHQRCRLWRLLR